MPLFKLILTEAPEGGTPRTYVFEDVPIVIGRDISSDLYLPDFQSTVSRRHAEIRRAGETFQLVDLGSKNATFLGKRRLEAGQPRPLKHGDQFRVGDFAVRFEVQASSRTEDRPDASSSSGIDVFHEDASSLLNTVYGSQILDATSAVGDEDTLRQANRELVVLSELAFSIGAARDVNVITDTIVRRSVEAVQAEQGSIMLVGEAAADPMQTLVRISTGTGEALRLNARLAAWMREYRRPLRLDASRTEASLSDLSWEGAIRSLLCIPLVAHGALLGTLTVFNKLHERGFTEGDERLLLILASQSAQVIENARLREQEKELIRMQEELHVAYRIQSQLLPKAPPRLPGYTIGGRSIPAQEVGGDFFDYITLPEERLGLVIGDVAGKGLPAALVMANAQAMLRSLAGAADTPAAAVGRTNDLLYESTEKRTFVTLCYAELDLASGVVRYVNAGHNRPLLRRADGTLETLQTCGPGLGMLSGIAFKQKTVTLSPGDLLVLYTDGIPEAMNVAHGQFGELRLEQGIRQHRQQASVERLIEDLINDVARHRGLAPPSDDVTLVVVKREGVGKG